MKKKIYKNWILYLKNLIKSINIKKIFKIKLNAKLEIKRFIYHLLESETTGIDLNLKVLRTQL